MIKCKLASLSIGDCRDERAGQQKTHARHLHQPATKLGFTRTGPNSAIAFEDVPSRLEHTQAEPGIRRFPRVILVVDDDK